MSKKSKKTTAPQPKFEINWPRDQWETGVSIVDLNDQSEKEYYWRDNGLILAMQRLTEETCCGFPQLGLFDCYNTKLLASHAKEMGEVLRDKMVAKKVPYMVTYLPNTKEWLHYRTLFEAAGFKPTISLPSKHGRYTNSRWEWFGPTFPKEAIDEKAVRPSIS